MDQAVRDYFGDRPQTFEIFIVVFDDVSAHGPLDIEVGSQISFAVKRKFAWFWLYNVTQKNPSGVLHAMVRLDREVTNDAIRHVQQISRNRWNHQVVVRSIKVARADWFRELLADSYRFGSGLSSIHST